ncbi:hypothetical protein F4806DRAFT_477531 [Annulohypoxylon nitens]|nr:hypothetical protein F4806DRAFT_477531 [Annulohypoxylon nitens]
MRVCYILLLMVFCASICVIRFLGFEANALHAQSCCIWPLAGVIIVIACVVGRHVHVVTEKSPVLACLHRRSWTPRYTMPDV